MQAFRLAALSANPGLTRDYLIGTHDFYAPIVGR
jgi:hypothetical protein